MLIAQVVIEEISYDWLFAKTILIMIVIIVLAFGILKYVLPRFVKMRRKSGSTIQVLDYQPLEQRKSVYLVQINDKKIAIGVTEHSIAKLCEWDDVDGSD